MKRPDYVDAKLDYLFDDRFKPTPQANRTKHDDPAYWMLAQGANDPSKRSTKTVHRDGCYICEDAEFMLMGLPLCKPCAHCADGHVAADEEDCDRCYKSIRDEPDARGPAAR